MEPKLVIVFVLFATLLVTIWVMFGDTSGSSGRYEESVVTGQGYGVDLITPRGWQAIGEYNPQSTETRVQLIVEKEPNANTPNMFAFCKDNWQPLDQFIATDTSHLAQFTPGIVMSDVKEPALAISEPYRLRMGNTANTSEIITYVKEEKEICILGLVRVTAENFDQNFADYQAWVNSFKFHPREMQAAN